jgi:hypothetical protein
MARLNGLAASTTNARGWSDEMSCSYNERLFEAGGLRGWIHNARFNWFRSAAGHHLAEHQGALRAIELGCFDGRLLSYFPREPEEYVGFDADVEGGLSAAQERFKGHSRWSFLRSTEPHHLASLPDKHFNIAAALETLEHVPPDLVAGYLRELARVTDGYLFVTVPNEKGVMFLAKYLAKKLAYGGTQPYRLSEVFYASAGRMRKVERDDHKGFDYSALIRLIEAEFDVLKVAGLPIKPFPPSVSATVTVVARSKGFPSRG